MNDFATLFGRAPVVTSRAPGRVNLIGEHTDYNGGFVLPTAIPQCCHVELAPRPDRTVRAWSTAEEQAGIAAYELGAESPGGGWLDYLQGVTRLLTNQGYAFHGFEVRLESHVPLGSGLSSSAAFTVSVMRALREAFHLRLDDVAIARNGQRVENEFVGAQVGIMDPMAASLADQGTALFLDARSLEYERVPLPQGADLVVIHSGIAHRIATGDYNTRRRECEEAAHLLGVPQLRDLAAADLPRVLALPEPLGRRARHVLTEDGRVLETVGAMRRQDLRRLGELFYASHRSMRDDYEVSVPEIDLLVDLAGRDEAVYGARLTGGGFGGSVVLLAHAGQGRPAAGRVTRAYAERTGQTPRVLVPEM